MSAQSDRRSGGSPMKGKIRGGRIRRAGVVQWQNTSFPSWLRWFDSHHLLHLCSHVAGARGSECRLRLARHIPARMDPVDIKLFTSAMRRAATPVSVVTTAGPGGRFGVTVSSICTASADPPQVLVCVHLGGPTAAAVRANECFAVNILDRKHRHVADSFAGRIERWRSDRFACDSWTEIATGAPVLTDGL